jgi:hypothetical protein
MTRDQLKNRIRGLVKQVYTVNKITPEEAAQYDELTKFPELKKVIVDLLTNEYDNFLDSIDWVSPRPTTFRINLKNGQDFYLIYGKRSWIAQVEGKKYYLLNLPEEERAAQAISRILRYGVKDEPTEEGGEELGGETPPPEETPTEEPPTEETPEA